MMDLESVTGLVVAAMLGFAMLLLALKLIENWPRQACRFADATWRADSFQPGRGFPFVYPPRYYAVAPWWYRVFTSLVNGWVWVGL